MADDIKQFIEDKTEETKRHFDVVAEDVKSEFQAVAEGVDDNTEWIRKLGTDVAVLINDVGEMKDTLEVLKLQKDLQQDIEALKERVAVLETNQKLL